MFQLHENFFTRQLQRIDIRLFQATFWLFWSIATTLMLLPADKLPHINIWDKAEHSGTFFALMVLVWLGYRRQYTALTLAWWLMGYGIGIECIQFFIPSRSFSVLDMLADATGILPAYWLAMKIKLV